jgi:hypothetical protein
MNINFRGALLLLVVVGSGCASTAKDGPYVTTVTSFNSGLKSANTLIETEVNAQTKARRLLAIQYYLDHPGDSSNISRDDLNGSFSRFACVGIDSLVPEKDGLAYLGRYGTALQDVVKTPDATIGALWTNIEALHKQQGPLPLAAKDATPALNTEKGCTDRIIADLAKPDVPLEPAQKESLAAFITLADGISKLASAVNSAIVDILKMANAQAEVEAFKRVVLANQEDVDKVLNNAALTTSLDLLWTRREQSSLILPFEQFSTMLKSEKKTRLEVLTLGIAASDNLKDFDAMRGQNPPSNLLKAVRASQDKLLGLAQGKITAQEAVAALKAFAQELGSIEKDAANIKSDAGSTEQAFAKFKNGT